MDKKLSAESKMALDRSLDGELKPFILNNNPNNLKNGIRQVNQANTDRNKRDLSSQELMSSLIANKDYDFKNRVEIACNIMAMHTHIQKSAKEIALEDALIFRADQGFSGVSLAKQIAESSGKPNHEGIIKKVIEQLTNSSSESATSAIAPALKKEAKEYIKPRAYKVSKEIVEGIDLLLQQYPNIKDGLLKLPKMSILKHLTVDHLCVALDTPTRDKDTTQTIGKR